MSRCRPCPLGGLLLLAQAFTAFASLPRDASGVFPHQTDAAGQSVKYDYYHNHFPKTRVWARGVGSTNLYSANGDLTRIDYSDGGSVVFTNEAFPTYDRLARPRMVSDATGTNVFTYDHAGRVVATTCTDGLLAGVTVTNHFHPAYGRDRLQVTGLATTLTHEFGYDAYGRLSTVANGDFWATYGYTPNSDLLHTTTCRSNAPPVLTTSRSWEYGMRLGAIVNEVNGVNVSSHSYTYDALNRRTRAALEDGSYWQYDYNDRNELTGARRYWPDMMPVSGQHFGYGYDNIGNRKTAQSGGDTHGWNLRETTYTANNLNQYTGIATPGYEDILGVALATNAVYVNGGVCDRKGEYFRRELSLNNGSGPLWTNVTVASGGVTNTGGLIVPDDNQTLTYDLDGNLTFDGVWRYEWDAENRLAAMTMTNVAQIANANRLRLEFTYDYQGRRVQKVVSAWNGSAFTSPVTNRFVYDGWNLLAILDSQSAILQSFTWGQDLSGTMQEAGGIGGLLLVTAHGGTATNCFVAYDGNGNVTALVRGGSDSVLARYEYSAFGETLRATGPLAKINPFRFSTKFADHESGLVYYGYRYYDPDQGRWLGRDPIEELDGYNLYAFVVNSPPNLFDSFGERAKGIITIGEMLPDVFVQLSRRYNQNTRASLARLGRYSHKLEEAQERTSELSKIVVEATIQGKHLGQALSEVFGGHAAAAFVQNAKDFTKHKTSGDTAWADLDAIGMAIATMEMTGDYVAAYIVLDILLLIPDKTNQNEGMSPVFSLFQFGKAPLNTTIEFVGFETLMGLGGAYFQVMFLVNLCALRLLCGLAAKGQTCFAEIIYGGIVIQFCEIILNATISKWLGVYSLGPIYVVTVLLLMKSCELPLSNASKIGGLYYAYHALSVICLRFIFQRLA